jgi:hypothetical protein
MFAGGKVPQIAEEPRASLLSFAGSAASIDATEVDQLARVREPVSRSKSGVQGKVADVAGGRSRHAESQNELKAFRVLAAVGQPDAWLEQPFSLKYHHEGRSHRYTPDILAIWGPRREVIEVKEDADANLPENQSRFSLIRGLLAEHGYRFRIWKSSEVCAEPRLANVSLILRYRCVRVPAGECETIRRAFSSQSELCLRTFGSSQSVVRNVLRLVLDGALHLDWWEPLDLDSRVSIHPIGLQVWPAPAATSG